MKRTEKQPVPAQEEQCEEGGHYAAYIAFPDSHFKGWIHHASPHPQYFLSRNVAKMTIKESEMGRKTNTSQENWKVGKRRGKISKDKKQRVVTIQRERRLQSSQECSHWSSGTGSALPAANQPIPAMGHRRSIPSRENWVQRVQSRAGWAPEWKSPLPPQDLSHYPELPSDLWPVATPPGTKEEDSSLEARIWCVGTKLPKHLHIRAWWFSNRQAPPLAPCTHGLSYQPGHTWNVKGEEGASKHLREASGMEETNLYFFFSSVTFHTIQYEIPNWVFTVLKIVWDWVWWMLAAALTKSCVILIETRPMRGKEEEQEELESPSTRTECHR